MCADISSQCIRILERCSKAIRGGVDTSAASIESVRVDHCHAHVRVTQKIARQTNVEESHALARLLTYHRHFPRITINTLRLAVGDDERVAEEDAEHAVGGDGVGLYDQHHAGLEHPLVLFGLDVVGEDMRLGADEVDAVNVDRLRGRACWRGQPRSSRRRAYEGISRNQDSASSCVNPAQSTFSYGDRIIPLALEGLTTEFG